MIPVLLLIDCRWWSQYCYWLIVGDDPSIVIDWLQVMILSGCSTVCTTLAEATSQWNLLTVCYGASSPALSNRIRYKMLIIYTYECWLAPSKELKAGKLGNTTLPSNLLGAGKHKSMNIVYCYENIFFIYLLLYPCIPFIFYSWPFQDSNPGPMRL
jgi:hypothetical protein